ncbi:MAG: cyclic nucleotide-binding domain-containing protein [Bradymonadia bacterium]
MDPQEARQVRARIRQVRQDLERMPHDLSLRETLGRLYLLTGQDTLGLKQLSMVAKARARVGDYLESIRLCNEIIAADPGRSEVALYLARLYAQAPELAHRQGLSATVATPPPAGASVDMAPEPQSEPVDAASLMAVRAPADLEVSEVAPGAGPSLPRDPMAPSTISLNIEDVDIEEVDDWLPRAVEAADPHLVTQVRGRPAVQDPRTQALMELIRSQDDQPALHIEDEADFADVSRAVFPDELASGLTIDDGLGSLLPESNPDPRGLPDIPLLSSLPHRAFVELIALAERHTAAPREVLVREGEPGDAIYIVLSGKVRVHTGVGARMVVLAELEPGAFFGEIALLSGQVRRATVTAAAPTEVFVIRGELLETLRQRYPVVNRTLTRFYETRLVARFLAISPLFHRLPVDERAHLSQRFHARALSRGETLFKQGDRPGGIWIVCEGRVQVNRGGHSLAVLGEGDLLGVVSTLTRDPLAATAEASTDCLIQVLDVVDVERVITQWPDVHQALVEMARRRQRAL